MEGNRPASKAGTWYKSNPTQLNSELELNLSNASKTKPWAKSIIGPHAGFDFSGPTAAWAYVHINPETTTRIFLLGPSHRAYIEGCALPASSIYETPLGNIPVDMDTVMELNATGLFSQLNKKVEEGEHSLELHLPYIRKACEGKDIKLVPIMVGQIKSNKAEAYGAILSQYYKDPGTVFIISTDFCHWGQGFDYIPYDSNKGQIWEFIQQLDMDGVRLIESHDSNGFNSYLLSTLNTICGQEPIKLLLNTIRQAGIPVKTEIVKYSQSEKATSKRDMSVSYASMVTWIEQ